MREIKWGVDGFVPDFLSPGLNIVFVGFKASVRVKPGIILLTSGNNLGRLYVQQRLVCSAGDRPARERTRIPVAWLAVGKETELLESNDKAV